MTKPTDATDPTTNMNPGAEPEGGAGASALDLASIRARYRSERAKRLRGDGNSQYLEMAGALAHFENDPWAPTPTPRAPVRRDVDVLLVGAGFGGLVAGARLRQRGIDDLLLIEKGSDVGGTWYWNRYPGVACDVESCCYLPLLEEVGGMPSRKYPSGSEIFAHCRALARRFELDRRALYQTEVRAVRWQAESARWLVETNRGDAIRARFVCMAIGFLEKPKLPGIPGIEGFEGRAFHTSRWDYAYTGGDSNGNLTGLRDKRVGIIGTGASAVQCVPHLGASSAHLYVFQRTPAGVDVRDDAPTDAGWFAGLRPGWQQERIENFQILTGGGRAEVDLVGDRWTDVPHRMAAAVAARLSATGREALPPAELAAIAEQVDAEKMEEIRQRIATVVKDPVTAEALKPWYRQFCKRPCYHDGYLPTFNRPNVTLVDTQGRGVERITKTGVVANGREYPLDCLVYATGFEVATEFARRAGYETTGRGGLTLSEKWRERYRSLHGLHVHGFPNCFIMSLAQSGYTLNFPYMIGVQASHIAYVVGEALARGARTIEATPEAEAEWAAVLAARAKTGFDPSFAEQCTPSYYNDEGKPDAKSLDRNFFIGGPTEFAEVLARWREEGSMRGLAVEA